MTSVWLLAALWLGLALVATLLSIWLRVATALSEIVVGTVAQLVIGAALGGAALGTDQSWIKFLSGTGAIVLTFLAGAELDPTVFRARWKEAGLIGAAGFLAPFFGVHGDRVLPPRLVRTLELARRRRAVDHLGGRRLRRHARVRPEPDGFRQGHPRRLLRERPRHGRRPGPHLRAVHDAGP